MSILGVCEGSSGWGEVAGVAGDAFGDAEVVDVAAVVVIICEKIPTNLRTIARVVIVGCVGAAGLQPIYEYLVIICLSS